MVFDKTPEQRGALWTKGACKDLKEEGRIRRRGEGGSELEWVGDWEKMRLRICR